MKHTFVLDENVLIHAVCGVKEDCDCATLIEKIAFKCHSIAFDNTIKQTYIDISDNLIKEAKGNTQIINTLIQKILLNSEKHKKYDGDCPQIPEEDKYKPKTRKKKDPLFARVAFYYNAKLVTHDKELRNDFNEHIKSFKEGIGTEALKPQEAVQFIDTL